MTIEKLGRSKHEVLNSAGKNEPWYYKAIKRKSMKIEDLEKITTALGLEMDYWWNEGEGSMVRDIGIIKFNKTANREMKELEEKIKSQNDTIINLNEYLNQLKDKLAIYENKKQKAG